MELDLLVANPSDLPGTEDFPGHGTFRPGQTGMAVPLIRAQGSLVHFKFSYQPTNTGKVCPL